MDKVQIEWLQKWFEAMRADAATQHAEQVEVLKNIRAGIVTLEIFLILIFLLSGCTTYLIANMRIF